jgi:6-phosphofructokinase 1
MPWPEPIRRIAINTGGGDAPGLNAVIHSAVLSARRRGWEVIGVRSGYAGLLDTDKTMRLTRDSVRGIAHQGGTILGTASRGNPLAFPVNGADGEVQMVDRSAEIVENFRRLNIDALIAIGGDGSMKIAHELDQKGIPIVGVPKTIDNDLDGTVVTFGFDTAVTVATEAVDRLHSTAEAHERVFTVELMGRYAGWIALYAGVAGGADAILIPEIPFDIEKVCDKVREREVRGRHFSIVVVAEGARAIGGELVTQAPQEPGGQLRLGGIGEQVAAAIHQKTGKETRSVVLGHLQRGGRPTPHDRLLAQRFGSAAVRVIGEGMRSVMVALDPPIVKTVALVEATRRMKLVPLDSDTVSTAREMGISLGD